MPTQVRISKVASLCRNLLQLATMLVSIFCGDSARSNSAKAGRVCVQHSSPAIQVNYVGKAVNLYEDAGYELNGTVYAINKHLGMTHVWDRVRVVGGAYGGFCALDSHSGQYTFLSYRCASSRLFAHLPGLLRVFDLRPALACTMISPLLVLGVGPHARRLRAWLAHC